MNKHWGKKMLSIVLLSALCISGAQLTSVSASAMSKTTCSVSKRNKTTATIKMKAVKGATGYQIYASYSKNGRYNLIGATRTTTFKMTKIKKNKVYYVKVKAYKTSGIRIVKSGFSKKLKVGKYVTVSTAQKYANEVLRLVNVERAKEGLGALGLNKKLTTAATTRAKELETDFSHTRPDGRDCFTILTDMDIVYSSIGENIAAGQATPAEVVASWMNSEGHRANIMSEDYTKLGLGFYKSSKGCQYYWCQIFMKV